MAEEQDIQAQLAKHGGGLKDAQYALGRIAYQNNIDPNDVKAYQTFVQTNPYAKQIYDQFTNHPDFVTKNIAPNLLMSTDLYRGAFARFRGDDIKRQQNQATERAFSQAEQYRQGMGESIQGEVGELRKSLSAQLAETRGQVKQQENTRGMLYSGRRQKREGEAQNLAAKTFSEGAADIAKGAMQTEQDLFGRASALKSGQVSAMQNANAIVDRAREARQAASQAMGSQFSNLLGQGIGSAAGKYRKSSTGNPTLQNTQLED